MVSCSKILGVAAIVGHAQGPAVERHAQRDGVAFEACGQLGVGRAYFGPGRISTAQRTVRAAVRRRCR